MLIFMLLLAGIAFLKQKWARALCDVALFTYIIFITATIGETPKVAQSRLAFIEIKNFFLAAFITGIAYYASKKAKKNNNTTNSNGAKNKEFAQNIEKTQQPLAVTPQECKTSLSENINQAQFKANAQQECGFFSNPNIKKQKSKADIFVEVVIILHTILCAILVIFTIFGMFVAIVEIFEKFAEEWGIGEQVVNLLIAFITIAICSAFCYLGYDYLFAHKHYKMVSIILLVAFGFLAIIAIIATFFAPLAIILSGSYCFVVWNLYKNLIEKKQYFP